MHILTWMLCSSGAAQQPSPTADEQARELFLEGDRHFARGDYARAVELFESAYTLSGRPELLFNLANAWVRMEDYGKAADYLRRYLKSPDIYNRESATARLEELERIASLENTENTVVTESTPSSRRRWPAHVLGGVTALSFGSAVTFGLLARDVRVQVAPSCEASPGGETLCLQTVAPLLEQERQWTMAATVSLATAGAAGLATVTAAVLSRRKERQWTLSVAPMRGGWSLAAGIQLGPNGRETKRGWSR